MATRRTSTTVRIAEDAHDALLTRVRKLRRRGETRKMLTALREACAREEHAAWLWTLYGAMLAANGRGDDAKVALRHALWLRRTTGDDRRARSTQSLIDALGLPAAA